MFRKISMSRVVSFSLVVGASCHMAVAIQAQDITQYISNSNVDAGIDDIKQYAQRHLDNLRSNDADARADAREALRDPLRDPTAPSVAFRLAYFDALRDSLQDMIGSGDAGQAINALYVMGDLGTTQAKDELLAALGSDDESIRYASATALRKTMEIINTGRSAIGNEQSVISAILQAMRDETSVLVIDAMVRALEPLQSNPDLRNEVNITICQGVVTYFRSTGNTPNGFQDAQTVLRALVTLRRTHIDLAGGVNRTLGLETGALAGQAMGELLRMLQSGGINDPELFEIASDGLIAAEALAGLANTSLDGNEISIQGINRAVRDLQVGGDLGPVESAVDAWIGATGILTRSPFNLNDADFAK